MKNKTILPLIISLLLVISLNAQRSLINNLKSDISTANDSLKSTLYHDLSLAYIRVDKDSSELYANLNYVLCQETNNALGIALSLENFGMIRSTFGDLDSSDYYFEKAYKIYVKHNNTNGKTTCLGWLSNNQSIRGNYDQSISILKSCIALKIAENDTANIQKYYQNIGVDNHLMGNFDEAERYYQKAIVLSKRVNDSISLGYLYGNLGQINISKSDYNTALDYLMLSQEYNEANGNLNGLANNYDRIGSIFLLQEKYELAIEYYKKASEGFKTLGYNDGVATTLLNIGNVFAEQKVMDSASVFYERAYIIAKEGQFLALQAAIEANLAEYYLVIDDLENAEKFSLKSLNNSVILQDILQPAETYITYGNVLLKKGKYRDALEKLHKAEALNIELNNLKNSVNVYNGLSNVYEEMGNTENYIKYYKLYADSKDSLNAQLNSAKFLDIQTKYQTAEKERDNQKLQFENEIQKQENAKIKARNVFLLILGGLVLVLLGVAFFVYKNVQKNRFNKLMLLEIDEQNDIIAKNLHDGMSGYLHAIKNSLVFRNEKTSDLNTEIDIIDRSQKELRFLMRQLSSPYYKNKNFDLSQELNALNSFYENTSNFKIDSYFDQNIVWDKISYENKLQIYKLAQELLANVKKHASASTISLQIIKDKHNLIFSFEDNGKGFDTNRTNQGHGLKNINKRIKELRGQMNIESNIGQGTFTTFTLPVLT